MFMQLNANCEHPEALIKLINFNNDRINSPDATLDSLEVWGVNSKTGIISVIIHMHFLIHI